ncbi:heterokaryon incompatibility protein-domain-containing protein [Lasiosphaeris hirsuta]|uniref:Heterokaryon incompatibility protein-domain-containing protein n=1 Tax=Lasiosphaeris hirsuta TaxID=260670 RepID=A0AA40A7P5_9PEZI|nr:heterokaryon incompatibility protein-domain-containing protein [Lasiosphaeris hirsuta]
MACQSPSTQHLYQHLYQPLPKRGSLRTATIHPGTPDDDIVISMQQVKFDDNNAAEFEALSYVWGSPDNPEVIFVCDKSGNHTTLGVTRNLACALRHVRYANRPRTMWIDAICIDQSNEAEKGPQVAMMSDIYQQAPIVVAWLGPERDGSEQAMDQISSFGSQIQWDWKSQKLEPSENSTNPSAADQMIPLPFNAETLSSIHHLLSRPWFERLWIRQEIYLANSHAIIMCGSRQILWSSFRHALIGITQKGCAFNFPEYHEHQQRINFLRDFIWQPRLVFLESLRNYFTNAKCGDPRDRIFGVLGLLNDAERALGIVPDYAKTVAQVYEDVVVRFLDRSGIEILHQCQYPGSGIQGPSWVPDWSQPSSVVSTLRTTFASSQLKSWQKVPEPGVLSVFGVSCVVVERVESAHFQNTDASDASKWKAFSKFQHTLSQLDLDRPSCTGGSTFDAYVRTLVCGKFDDWRYPPQENYPNMEAGRAALRTVLEPPSALLTAEPWRYFSVESSARRYISEMVDKAKGRALFNGGENYVGYAPASAQPGDQVCVLLGCSSPLALRPVGNGGFLVVGECFVPGISQGEAFLGPLPPNVQLVGTDPPEYENLYPTGFFDTSTGLLSFEDPRLSQLPIDLGEFRQRLRNNPVATIEVDHDILRQRGVNLVRFDLV